MLAGAAPRETRSQKKGCLTQSALGRGPYVPTTAGALFCVTGPIRSDAIEWDGETYALGAIGPVTRLDPCSRNQLGPRCTRARCGFKMFLPS